MTTDWFEHFLPQVRDFIPSDAGLPASLCLGSEGKLRVMYSPFEYVNPDAKVVLVGITPGLQQANNALVAARDAVRSGISSAAALRIAKATASFSGPMRSNLIRCLDAIGLQDRLQIASCQALFGEHAGVVNYTSVLRFPVFFDGVNYNRQIPIRRSPYLQRWVSSEFAQEVITLRDALWIPLGEQPADVLGEFVRGGQLRASQVLSGVPHPSGANAERVACFCGSKAIEAASAKTDARKLIADRDRLRVQVASAF